MAQAPQQNNDAEVLDENASKKKRLLLLVGLAVILILVSVGGTVLALKVLIPPSEDTAPTSVSSTPAFIPALYFEMTPNFTINFTVNGRQRYLQAAVTLLYRDPTLESMLNLHMPAIRNGLVMLFSSKNFEELQTPEGREQLKVESLQIVQSLLRKEQDALVARGVTKGLSLGTVEQVLFTNFVMQ